MEFVKEIKLSNGTAGQVIGTNGRILEAIIHRICKETMPNRIPLIDTYPGKLVVCADSFYVMEKIVEAIQQREQYVIDKNWMNLHRRTQKFHEEQELNVMDKIIEQEIQQEILPIVQKDQQMGEAYEIYKEFEEDCELWENQTRYGTEYLDQDAFMEITIADVLPNIQRTYPNPKQ